MRTEARAAAAVRHDEARRVVEAYAVQVERRRKRWIAAADGPAANAARRALSEALVQHDWAQQREREAWRNWHAVESGGTPVLEPGNV